MEKNLSQLMEKNMLHVWNERNPETRLKALKGLYFKDSSLFEFNQETIGYEGINQQVSNLLDNLPVDFVFTMLQPVQINSNVGRMVWGVGPENQEPAQTGMDIAFFEKGKIKLLYVFLEKQSEAPDLATVS